MLSSKTHGQNAATYTKATLSVACWPAAKWASDASKTSTRNACRRHEYVTLCTSSCNAKTAKLNLLSTIHETRWWTRQVSFWVNSSEHTTASTWQHVSHGAQQFFNLASKMASDNYMTHSAWPCDSIKMMQLLDNCGSCKQGMYWDVVWHLTVVTTATSSEDEIRIARAQYLVRLRQVFSCTVSWYRHNASINWRHDNLLSQHDRSRPTLHALSAYL